MGVPATGRQTAVERVAQPVPDECVTEFRTQGDEVYAGLDVGYVRRRLSEIFPLAWSDEYRFEELGEMVVVTCRLTVVVGGETVMHEGAEIRRPDQDVERRLADMRAMPAAALKKAAASLGPALGANLKSGDGDGGEPDGGEPDGGEPDGGEPDGGEPDGGEPGGAAESGGAPEIGAESPADETGETTPETRADASAARGQGDDGNPRGRRRLNGRRANAGEAETDSAVAPSLGDLSRLAGERLGGGASGGNALLHACQRWYRKAPSALSADERVDCGKRLRATDGPALRALDPAAGVGGRE